MKTTFFFGVPLVTFINTGKIPTGLIITLLRTNESSIKKTWTKNDETRHQKGEVSMTGGGARNHQTIQLRNYTDNKRQSKRSEETEGAWRAANRVYRWPVAFPALRSHSRTNGHPYLKPHSRPFSAVGGGYPELEEFSLIYKLLGTKQKQKNTKPKLND